MYESTVEPCLSDTPFIRSPSYHDLLCPINSGPRENSFKLFLINNALNTAPVAPLVASIFGQRLVIGPTPLIGSTVLLHPFRLLIH